MEEFLKITTTVSKFALVVVILTSGIYGIMYIGDRFSKSLYLLLLPYLIMCASVLVYIDKYVVF